MKTTILIPTFDNIGFLGHCLNSILGQTHGMLRVDGETYAPPASIVILNNGQPELVSRNVEAHPSWRVVDLGTNEGWERALQRGVKETKSPYVMFLNDDTQILPGHGQWLERMTGVLDRFPAVGAVGPMSNFVMGRQHMWQNLTPDVYETKLLIGFCLLVRREALERAGGVQTDLPGGDDFDLCIRLRKAGYRLALHAEVFVFHHGCQTGVRVHREMWNSPQMIEETRRALILKHSLADFLACVDGNLRPLR